MLDPTNFPVPAPPAGQRREVNSPLPISRRIKIAFVKFANWYGNMRPCDRAALDSVGLAGFAIGVPIMIVVILQACGVDVVSHLPSAGGR